MWTVLNIKYIGIKNESESSLVLLTNMNEEKMGQDDCLLFI